MPATPLDSALYRDLFGDEETQRLFTDSAEIRAMLIVEGALAKAQGAAGLIPETAAAFIHRASLEVQIDPAGLAAATGQNAVPVPAFVAAFRKAMEAPEHAQYLHWGATSQDIMDTALILRLRQVLALHESRLIAILRALGALAERHAALPMTGRSYAQAATPTSFGAVAAGWGAPLLAAYNGLGPMRERLLCVSLSGAAGTLSVMGEKGAAIRASLASGLGLGDPGASWHTSRDRIADYAGWMAGIAAALARMSEDLILLTQSGFAEVTLGGGGASSTMPQKQNPVLPSLISALGRTAIALEAAIRGASIHRQQRDGTAWFAEWLTLPQLCVIIGRALAAAADLVPRVAPLPKAMAAHLADGQGLVMAEALTFALAARMPRPEAEARVKALCTEAMRAQTPLAALAERDFPGGDWNSTLRPGAHLGLAPAEARAFAAACQALPSATGTP